MKIKEKNKINYCIDTIVSSDTRDKVVIRGWGFNRGNATPIKIFLPQYTEGIDVKYLLRKDVNSHYHIKEKKKLGFEITIVSPQTKLPHKYEIVLVDENGGEYKVKVDERKLGKLPLKTMMRLYGKILKNKGIKKMMHRFRHQKNNIWYEYDEWIYEYESFLRDNDFSESTSGRDLLEIEKEIDAFVHKPKVSIVIPVYNVEIKWLYACVNSIKKQVYSNWELCFADDCSTNEDIKPALEKFTKEDVRIKAVFRKKNGHISEATNSALEIATGDYIGFMDNDDVLAPNALFEYVKAINEDPKTDFIYCDEDMIDTQGKRYNPFFKSAWNEELLLNHNYITHFVMVKRSLYEKVGGLKSEYNGSQDYEFTLRATEKAEKITHIPKMLYHWRSIEGSVAENPEAKNYAYEAGKRAIEDTLQRRGVKGKVSIGEEYGTYDIVYNHKAMSKVSIIAINKSNNIKKIKFALDSLVRSDYKDFEIIAVDYPDLGMRNNLVYFQTDENMSLGEKINRAVSNASGDYFVIINSTIKPTNSKWLKRLLNMGLKEDTGVIGGKILDYKNNIYHAGFVYDKNKEKFYHTHQGKNRRIIGLGYRLYAGQEVLAVSEEFIGISKKNFNEINGVNEILPYGFLGIDLCLRLREIGQKVLWTPEAVVRQSEILNESDEPKNLEIFWNIWKNKRLDEPYTNPFLIMKRI